MRIQLERGGRLDRRILLRSPFSSAVVEKCRSISGSRPSYDSQTGKFKYWSLPLSYGTCLELRGSFAEQLDIGPRLWEWAVLEQQRAARLDALHDAEFVDCPRIRAQAPKLWEAMKSRPYQTVGAAFCATARYALNGDDPGLGKTLETFGAVIEAGIDSGPILVFCPVTAMESTWMREIWQWLPDDDVIVCTGTRKQRDETFRELLEDAPKTGRRTWFICNIEMTRTKFNAFCPGPTRNDRKVAEDKDELPIPACDGETSWCGYAERHDSSAEHNWPELFQSPWQAVVLDESHKALITTKTQLKKQSQKRVGFTMLPIVDDGLRLALSGTPWRGKAENFFGTLNWLRPDIYTSYWKWSDKYWDIFVDPANNGHSLGDMKEEMTPEWTRELRSIMIRRTKAEKLPGLPPKAYAGTEVNGLHGVWLEMTPAQTKSYGTMVKSAMANLSGGKVIGKGVLAQMMRLRQFAICAGVAKPVVRTRKVRFFNATTGALEIKKVKEPDFTYDPVMPSNKFDWLLEFIDEHGILDNAGESKIVVASKFTEIINLFRAELHKLGVESHCLTGETTLKERTRQVAEFQSDGGPRIFFLNTDAGGVSLTLDAADDLVMLDRSWIPDDDTQVEDRLHRASRMHQVTIYYLYSLGTIDEYVGTTAEFRDELQRRLLDGVRGIDSVKRLVGVA